MQCEYCGGEIDNAKVLSHVQSLRSRMRKSFKGAKPRVWKCPRCGVECLGRQLYEAHFAVCAAGPLESVTPEDVAKLAWTPDSAA